MKHRKQQQSLKRRSALRTHTCTIHAYDVIVIAFFFIYYQSKQTAFFFTAPQTEDKKTRWKMVCKYLLMSSWIYEKELNKTLTALLKNTQMSGKLKEESCLRYHRKVQQCRKCAKWVPVGNKPTGTNRHGRSFFWRIFQQRSLSLPWSWGSWHNSPRVRYADI